MERYTWYILIAVLGVENPQAWKPSLEIIRKSSEVIHFGPKSLVKLLDRATETEKLNWAQDLLPAERYHLATFQMIKPGDGTNLRKIWKKNHNDLDNLDLKKTAKRGYLDGGVLKLDLWYWWDTPSLRSCQAYTKRLESWYQQSYSKWHFPILNTHLLEMWLGQKPSNMGGCPNP